jgi:hypothetical protein
MQYNHNRTVKIKKNDLIQAIKKNRETHIEDFNRAVEAYKIEAIKQLKNGIREAKNGSLKVSLNLVTPIDRSAEYDKIIKIFEWEIANEVELTQKEFLEYVEDDNDYAKQALFCNSTYTR